jgi:hypothetical protein
MSHQDRELLALVDVNKLKVGLYEAVIPLTAGASVAWFCLRMIRTSSDIGARAIILVAVLMLTMFADVYAVFAAPLVRDAARSSLDITFVFERNEGLSAQFALPNLAFVIGLLLFILFRYDKASHKNREN